LQLEGGQFCPGVPSGGGFQPALAAKKFGCGQDWPRLAALQGDVTQIDPLPKCSDAPVFENTGYLVYAL
jgi:hypothetical protein